MGLVLKIAIASAALAAALVYGSEHGPVSPWSLPARTTTGGPATAVPASGDARRPIRVIAMMPRDPA